MAAARDDRPFDDVDLLLGVARAPAPKRGNADTLPTTGIKQA
jgi:hypothetical protein